MMLTRGTTSSVIVPVPVPPNKNYARLLPSIRRDGSASEAAELSVRRAPANADE
jgi:hypothetical protein